MNEEYRKSFSEALSGSRSAVLKAQEYIVGLKIPTLLNPTIMVPPGGNPNNYKDGGDLYMLMRTEVKHPNLQWTNKDDYPFPDIIICACDSFDDQAIPPKYYMIWNKEKTSAMSIEVNRTKSDWFKRDIRDSRAGRGYSYPCYMISKEHSEIQWIMP